MKAFTFKDPDGNGKADTYGLGAYIELKPSSEGLGCRFDPWFGAFGVAGTWSMAKESAGLNINKPEYYDTLVFLKKIIDAKVIDPNWTAYKKDDYRASWKQGKFGIFREQNAAAFAEANYAPFDQNFPKGELIIIDPPVGPKGKSAAGVYDQAYRRYCVAAANANQTIKNWKDVDGSKKNITKKQMIARLLEWMSSDEGYFLLGYGVEGVNWMRDPKTGAPTKDGIPDKNLAYSKPKMQPLTQLRNMVYYNGDIELASRYPTWYSKNGKEMSALKTLREMQAKAWTACIGQDKMPQPNADVKRFYEQGIVEFMTGNRTLNPTEWQKFLEEFDKIGGKDWNDAGVKLAKEKNLIK
jgi:putative aldouronate transport system substrate-binding protein